MTAGADQAGDLGAEVLLSYFGLYESDVLSQIALVVGGLPAVDAKHLLDLSVLGRTALLSALDLSVATFKGSPDRLLKTAPLSKRSGDPRSVMSWE